ncbi:hypothetical protein NFI96_009660, partial [Prochilodus magdalenae]
MGSQLRTEEVFFPRSFTIAILDDRALQHLAAELAQLDRQITALLKKQKELLQMKSQLEASMGVSRWSASSSAASEVSPSVLAPPRPQHMPGHAIFTPVPQGVWKRQRRRGPTRPSPPPQPSFAHDNQFSALSSLPTPTPASRPPSPAPAPRASSQDSVYVIGSSIVRHVKVNGARVIHMGTNDICARQSEGCERFSRLIGLQSRLHGWCAVNGLGFVDNWSSFWEQPALYRRDRLHPSHLGSRILSRNIERAVCRLRTGGH